jgi:hypothetical protein
MARLAYVVLLGLSRIAFASSESSCGQSGQPWVSVGFAEGSWSEGLRQAALQDLKAGLATRHIDTCQEGDGPARPPVAAIRITSSGAESVQVTVEIRDSVTEKRVSRDVDLSSVPLDGRAFAIALAADELVWASWAEIGYKGTKRRSKAPPQLVAAVEQSLQVPTREANRLGAQAAAEHFGAGMTQFGADALYVVALARRFRLRIAGGVRQGLTVGAPDGHIQSTAAGMAIDGGILLLRSSHIELTWTIGGRAAWIHLQGKAAPTALDNDLSGLVVYARTGLNVALHPGGPLWFEFGAGSGVPLRALQATDAGRIITGASGLEQSASIAVLGEL